MRFHTTVLATLIACFALAPARAEVTLDTLLDEMTDLEALTTMPDPVYTTKQFSSWDRRSTDPEVATDENWFGNWDRGRYLRREKIGDDNVYVLMDAEGPGTIVRFWSANPDDAGNIRIYIDGAEEPTLDVPLTTWLGGDHAIAPKPIAGMRGMGWNNYLPIPYAKSVKVVATGWDFYYHINYRTYDPDTNVESFSLNRADDAIVHIDTIADALSAPKTAAKIPDNAQTMGSAAILSPGDTRSTGIPDGPAALYAISGSVEAEDLVTALRGTWLEINFDEHPTVAAPLGDFLGTAPGPNPYASLPLGMEDNGAFYCHWIMPFKETAHVALNNRTDADVKIDLDITYAPREWTEDTRYFHAKFKGEREIPTQPRQDWNYLDVTGSGRFVGVSLHVANPVADWWGEGDEKIYVDGEDFPSHFGTGTEDYYGYAWCSPEVFTHAFHNQPRCDGPGNYGHTSVNRFHILDNIPFQSAFKLDMEIWHWKDTTMDQDIVAYWYADGNATDTMPSFDETFLTIPDIPKIELKQIENAIEAEDLKALEVTGGDDGTQTSYAWPWSNGEQRWWRNPTVGDKLVLAVPAEDAGPQEIYARFTYAPDYGIATFTVNDNPETEPIDFYDTTVTVGEEILLGTYDLNKGDNALTITITITGKHPDAIPYHMIGIDYLRLEPSE